MDFTLLQIIAATTLISLISLIGIITLSHRGQFFNKHVMLLVSFAAGAMLAAVFLDLLPEAYELVGNFYVVLAGIVVFLIIESVIQWHHHHGGDCHEEHTKTKPLAYLNIIGDGVHNFLDGILIAASFMVNTGTGIATSLAVALHEIPQEIGDFALLRHAGMPVKKALFFNFLSSITAIAGGIFAFFFLSSVEGMLPYMISLAAGGLLYIATTDVLPELHKNVSYGKIIKQLLAFILGVALISFILLSFGQHAHGENDVHFEGDGHVFGEDGHGHFEEDGHVDGEEGHVMEEDSVEEELFPA